MADNGILGSPLPEFYVVSGDKLWMTTWSHGLVGFGDQKWQFYDPDVDVNWLVQTPDGRLWTESWDLDGIASFDGQKWQLEFNTDNSLLDEPKTNTALVTSTGQILLGTDQGLFQYNPNLNTLSDLVLGKVSVNKILESRDGSIWVRAEGEKKEKRFYQRNNGKWTTVLADQGLTTLYQLDNHDLWAGGTNGLFRFNGESWQLQLGRKINCIYQLADGTMLAGTDSGLWIEQVNEENNLTSAQLGLFIKAIFQDSNGTDATNWGRQLRDWLWQGKTVAALQSCRSLGQQLGLSRPVNKAQTKLGQTSLQSFYLYLRNNLDSMVDYQTYRRKGYFISSVWVEKTIDLLICRRLKLRGQNWSRQGAENMVTFRQLILNDHWKGYWQQQKAS